VTQRFSVVGAASLLVTLGCHRAAAPSGPPATPIYNSSTGQLEQVVSDTDGDGKIDTRAYMDGRLLRRIEIDRNADGTPDRWEHYAEAPPERVRPDSPDGRVEIDRVDEANGPDDRITLREFYERGELARVEDDSNLDGRVDRWEHYQQGTLTRLELDTRGTGVAERRLLYRKDGTIERIEVDPAGTGAWQQAPAASSTSR
jgi:hypothetical protein